MDAFCFWFCTSYRICHHNQEAGHSHRPHSLRSLCSRSLLPPSTIMATSVCHHSFAQPRLKFHVIGIIQFYSCDQLRLLSVPTRPPVSCWLPLRAAGLATP